MVAKIAVAYPHQPPGIPTMRLEDSELEMCFHNSLPTPDCWWIVAVGADSHAILATILVVPCTGANLPGAPSILRDTDGANPFGDSFATRLVTYTATTVSGRTGTACAAMAAGQSSR